MIDAHVHIETRPYRPESIWEYVTQAEAVGLTELYLLEHSYQFKDFSELYRRHILADDSQVGVYQRGWLERKLKRSLTEYIRLIQMMREIDFPVKVHWGLEICYFPGEETTIKEIVSGFDWDYLVGAVHWLNGWGFDHPRNRSSWNGKNINDIYRQYFKIMKQMISSGLFDHIAHADSLKCFGHYPTFDLRTEYSEIAALARQHQVKLEFNCGLRLNYNHPELGLNPVFLKTLRDTGVPIVTASNAHHPEEVGKFIREAEELIKNV